MGCNTCERTGWRRHSAAYIGEMRSIWLEPCEDCLDSGLCPECGAILEIANHQFESECAQCGWYSDDGWHQAASKESDAEPPCDELCAICPKYPCAKHKGVSDGLGG